VDRPEEESSFAATPASFAVSTMAPLTAQSGDHAKLTRHPASRRTYLQRVDHPSEDAVRQALTKAGYPVVATWLAFHASFAGFVEPLGAGEVAVYGLLHAHGRWLQGVEAEADSEGWIVMCADVHPSYDYWLTEEGELLGVGGGGPFQSFSVKVERDAIVWAQTRAGWRLWQEPYAWQGAALDAERDKLSPYRVREASDGHSVTYLAPNRLVVMRSTQVLLAMAP
jgi:hypothetical protein